jgi:hypothetical protein
MMVPEYGSETCWTDFTVKKLYCVINKKCAFVGLRNV